MTGSTTLEPLSGGSSHVDTLVVALRPLVLSKQSNVATPPFALAGERSARGPAPRREAAGKFSLLGRRTGRPFLPGFRIDSTTGLACLQAARAAGRYEPKR